MVRFGYKLMSEEHGPLALVENARHAERAGFDFVAISDHYHPWLKSHGHSPFAWSVLGAVAAQTSSIGIATAVTCPFLRYHPAIIAQAAATIAVISGERFALGLGAGERLNEHVIGTGWPSASIRHEMLEEAIDIIRLLWQGGTQSYFGRYVKLENARIYDLPKHAPQILVAISGRRSAKMAAEKADGIFATESENSLIEAWASQGGGKGPKYVEVAVSWAPTKEEALRVAHERFRFGALGWRVMADLPNVENFEAASRFVRPEDIQDLIPCGPDVEAHAARINRALEAGFDHVVIIPVGPNQAGFFKFWEEKLQPVLRSWADRSAA